MKELLQESLLFSIMVAAAFTMIIQTLEKWNFSEIMKSRYKFKVCYFCLSFWSALIVSSVYFECMSANYFIFIAPLAIPALTTFIHNSPLKGL